jgi:hypothetical protein
MPLPPVVTEEMGLVLTSGSSTFGTYSWNTTTLFDDLSNDNFTATVRWFTVTRDGDTNELVSAVLINNPAYTTTITSTSLSTGDTKVIRTVSTNVLTLSGSYSGITFPSNILQGIFHNGINTEYLTEGWGVAVDIERLLSFTELDALTSFVLTPDDVDVTFTVNASGVPGTGSQTATFTIDQTVNNLPLSGGALNSYIAQTYFGSKKYPLLSEGGLNPEYFDGLKYEN